MARTASFKRRKNMKTNEKPIAGVTLNVIAEYPDGRKYAVKHSYCMRMGKGNSLLLPTVINVLEQRFPHAKRLNFVSEKEFLDEVEKGAIVQTPVDNKRTVLFDALPE